jgi:DNA gyrase subunit B
MLDGLLGEGAKVKCGEQIKSMTNFKDAIEWLLGLIRRNVAIQRYKGLGEMNPEQ